ncbi:G-protein coupled receptor Mth2-like isoform X5 [Harmonia axyridis]|uniref:G-protein coupled receptor Mth2-like isoform X5 n=1 Tax=Harmonia axyridis TaxID=115357 RepID=UPI001E274EBA|nr:G-protein coupled receptor Mth2-like isoform X5 [Harmonia axyridis]
MLGGPIIIWLALILGDVICEPRVKTIFVKDAGVCQSEPCIRKCCPEGTVFFRKKCIEDTSLGFPVQVFNGQEADNDTEHVFHVIVDSSCKSGVKLGISAKYDKFFVQPDGSMLMPELELTIPYDKYCLDHFKTNRSTSFAGLRCDEEIELQPPETKVYNYGMVISMPFLLITFIVYALLPDRNLHMKALMCYVINLLLAYMFIVTIQLSDTVFPDDICAILGFGCIFFFLSSFFWMNVICIDIFLGFRGIRGGPGIRSSEWKRFLIYCIYAWGMSLLIVFITFMINTYVNPISIFHPGVAIGQCFIRDGLPMLLYFYGPMGILIISNVLLFALTALRIRKVKKDTAMLKHSGSKRHSDDEQQNFNLYFKLLLAMGVNWSMEIISWAVTLPQYFWYLSDICNALYGVIIFFIFVFKRNIWKQLKRRYYSFMGRHHMAHSMGTTNFTKTTNDSMTVSTNDRAMEESELNTSRMN